MLSIGAEEDPFFLRKAPDGTLNGSGGLYYSKAMSFQSDCGENMLRSSGNLFGSYIRFFISSKKSTLCAI